MRTDMLEQYQVMKQGNRRYEFSDGQWDWCPGGGTLKTIQSPYMIW